MDPHQAPALLKLWLAADPDKGLFSPADSRRAFEEARTAKTLKTGRRSLAGKKKKLQSARGKRRPAAMYSTASYATPGGERTLPAGPPTYKLADDADVTVLLFVDRKVVANFAFRQGGGREGR